MNLESRVAHIFAFVASIVVFAIAAAVAAQGPGASPQTKATTLSFGGKSYVHCWTRNGIGEWLQTNGPGIEKTLMTWDKIPSPSALQQLPQSK